MDGVERIKEDVRQGRIGVERLIEVIGALQRELEGARREQARLEKSAARAARRDLRH